MTLKRTISAGLIAFLAVQIAQPAHADVPGRTHEDQIIAFAIEGFQKDPKVQQKIRDWEGIGYKALPQGLKGILLRGDDSAYSVSDREVLVSLEMTKYDVHYHARSISAWVKMDASRNPGRIQLVSITPDQSKTK